MRLLNTETFNFTQFYVDIPKYAILSHTWDEEEVTFQDMQNLEAAKSKAGWRKVEKASAHAKKYDFEWIWIDSCCINKESSAELSEAINSMYQYYEDSEVCYAYLSDASSKENPRDATSKFWECKWFKRGWTLQELLAPEFVVFLDSDWKEIGTRWSLRDVISLITTIPITVFEHGHFDRFSVAQKMSWASHRVTARPEDLAYCLMGIFGVSMPPIYGEGSTKAFLRLQQEIIKISDDRSIFAWVAEDEDSQRGLFAKSPAEFCMSGEVGKSDTSEIHKVSSYSFANNGLHIHIPLPAVHDDSDHPTQGLFLASLHCRSLVDDTYISIYLRKEGRGYVRCYANELARTHSPPALESLQEVIVKEGLTLRKAKLKSYSPISDMFHISLRAQSSQVSFQEFHLIRTESYESSFQEHSEGRIDIIVNSLLGTQLNLKYRMLTAGEDFTVTIAGCSPVNSNHLKINRNPHIQTPMTILDMQTPLFFDIVADDTHRTITYDDKHGFGYKINRAPSPYEDRIYKILEKGFVALRIQTVGNHPKAKAKIIEIDYILRENPEYMLSTRRMVSPKLGFMAPRTLKLELDMISNAYFSLLGVFPPDPLQKGCGSNTYISISDPEYSPHHGHRVLVYFLGAVHQRYHGFSTNIETDTAVIERVIYIAVGFHGSEHIAWTDITLSGNNDVQGAAVEIWESYLQDNGSKESSRPYQDSASICLSSKHPSSGENFRLRIPVVVKKRMNVQLGSHFLRLGAVSKTVRPKNGFDFYWKLG